MRPLLGLCIAAVPALAPAHEGHGLAGHHWHASDTLGYVLLALALGVVLWAARRK
jgi:predicted alpha/beta hydrolase